MEPLESKRQISCYCSLDEHICFITTVFQLSGDKNNSELDSDLTPLWLWSEQRASLNDVITWHCSFQEVWIHRDETSIPPGWSMDQAFSEEMWGINNVQYERFVITFIRHLLEWDERDENGMKDRRKKAE